MSSSDSGIDDFLPGESVVERRIRLAMDRGEFTDLPGMGEPIDSLEESYDPLWWVKAWAEREGVTAGELAAFRARRPRRN